MEDESYPMPPAMLAGQATEGSLRFQLEVDEQIRQLEHDMKGEYFTAKGYVKREGFKPYINDFGVASLLSMLRMNLSKVFILSDLDDEVVDRMAETFARNIKNNLHQNWDAYEVRDDTAASIILHTLADSYYATLRKAVDGTYLKFLRTTHSVQEMSHNTYSARPQNQPKEDGIMSFLKRKRR